MVAWPCDFNNTSSCTDFRQDRHPHSGQARAGRLGGTDEQLRLAAALQQASEHPLALAMREAVGKEVALPQPEAVEVRVGAGILGQVAGHSVAIGNPALLAQLGIEQVLQWC